MKLTLEEMETIIRWDRANPEAIVYTFEPSLKRKLKDLASQFPDKVKLICEDNGSTEYRLPKSLISVRKPRTISDEERERLKASGSNLRKRPEADSDEQIELQA